MDAYIRRSRKSLWTFAREHFALSILVAFLIAHALFLALGLQQKWPCFFNQPDCSGKRTLSTFAALQVILWAIVPPAWFFLETYTYGAGLLPCPEHATNPSLKARYDRFRLAQDLASKFWLAVLGVIIFLVSKT